MGRGGGDRVCVDRVSWWYIEEVYWCGVVRVNTQYLLTI